MTSMATDTNTLKHSSLTVTGCGCLSTYGDSLFVGREQSIKALEVAMAADKQILLVSQKNATEDQPSEKSFI